MNTKECIERIRKQNQLEKYLRENLTDLEEGF